MMMCFFQGYNIPVPGLMPFRDRKGFGMEHLSALFMLDPCACRGALAVCPACALMLALCSAAVHFISIMYIGYEPFLFFFLVGGLFMSSPFGHAWRKGRSPQAAMDELFSYARQAGYFVVLFKARGAACSLLRARWRLTLLAALGVHHAALFPAHRDAGGEGHALV